MEKKILMVCLGNICRSPLAEGILKSKLDDTFQVDSCGTISYHEGKPADLRAIRIAIQHGVDISNHRAKYLYADQLEDYDHIYCMDLKNYEDVISMAKNDEQRKKISLILEEAGNFKNAEVPDPYYGEMEDFDRVYNMLDEACEVIANRLKEQK